jgi:putative ABC transport system substrate-binding protein
MNALTWKIVLVTIAVITGASLTYFAFATSMGEKKIIGIARWDDSAEYSTNIQGFKDGLQRMGYVEGINVSYLVESAHSNASAQKEIIKDFIDKKVDMIYTLTTPGTLIAKNETRTIPIVFSIVLYPVDAGLIKNWYASENNLVGTSNHVSIEKQFSFYSELVPIKKVAFVHRQGEPNSQIQLEELKNYASENNMTVVDIAATDLKDLKEKISSSIDEVDSTYESCDTLVQNGGDLITTNVAISHKKPSFSCHQSGAENGALAADAPDFYKLGLVSGQKAGFVLQGIRPESLVSDVDANEYTIINLKTAQKLGLNVTEYLQYRAAEVIR